MHVRYQAARDFVKEYAENLSKGGLFIRGATDLQPRQTVIVELTLPGYAPVKVVAEVAHIITPGVAATLDRQAGAGFAITRAPSGFKKALRSYLHLLGRRRDCVVFAMEDDCLAELDNAGYQALPAPPPEEVVAALERAPKPVIGIVVPRAAQSIYATTAFTIGRADLVHGADEVEKLEQLFAKLDARIPVQEAMGYPPPPPVP